MEKTAGRQTLQRTKENKKILVTAQIKLLFKDKTKTSAREFVECAEEETPRSSVLADLECRRQMSGNLP